MGICFVLKTFICLKSVENLERNRCQILHCFDSGCSFISQVYSRYRIKQNLCDQRETGV